MGKELLKIDKLSYLIYKVVKLLKGLIIIHYQYKKIYTLELSPSKWMRVFMGICLFYVSVCLYMRVLKHHRI